MDNSSSYIYCTAEGGEGGRFVSGNSTEERREGGYCGFRGS